MVLTVLQVALGGAIGASLRYLSGVAITRVLGTHSFPLGVITVNILGSFLMGALIVFLGQKGLVHWNAFLATGVLGGFTTFSSFSLETLTLFERGEPVLAAVYVILSVALSLAGIVAGTLLMRAILT